MTSYALQTLGHATMLITSGDEVLLCTDPWLVGSVYWRSWWLERYPSPGDVELLGAARFAYVTHSHPDHFHWPSLRQLPDVPTLHPTFPNYVVPPFLRGEGRRADELRPWAWYALADDVSIASVPVPIDDSILVVRTPKATVVNLNDSIVRRSTLALIRERLCDPARTTVVLRSYSPASVAASIFRDGVRLPIKSKADYVSTARSAAEGLGAAYFVPFASQVRFERSDSAWAAEFKVHYDDLRSAWGASEVTLLPPHVTLDLESFDWSSEYQPQPAPLSPDQRAKVERKEQEERQFTFGRESRERLEGYLRQLPGLRILYRHGLGFRLATSGRDLYYDVRRRTVVEGFPVEPSVTLTLPDAVLDDALRNGILTDLGISMLVRVDTRVPTKLAYSLFLLMGLRDYGHLRNLRAALRFGLFYARYTMPPSLRLVSRRSRAARRPLPQALG